MKPNLKGLHFTNELNDRAYAYGKYIERQNQFHMIFMDAPYPVIWISECGESGIVSREDLARSKPSANAQRPGAQ